MRIDTVDQIHKRYQHLYFSPHLDDVVLSCAGRILHQINSGDHVLVVTVFNTYTDVKKKLHRAYQHLTDCRTRVAEDRAAMTLLGVDYAHLDYYDAIVRLKYKILRFRISTRVKQSSSFYKSIYREIYFWAKTSGASNLYFPLGVGHHFDHLILYDIGKKLSASGAYKVKYYEDMPYCMIHPAYSYRMNQIGGEYLRSDGFALKNVLADISDNYRTILQFPSLRLNNWFAKTLFLPLFFVASLSLIYLSRLQSGLNEKIKSSPDTVDITNVFDKKLKAALCYKSQLAPNLFDIKDVEEALSQRAKSFGAKQNPFIECCWHIASE